MPGLSVNSTIGEYRITAFLGAGGMGEVYLAEHGRIGRPAAVKVLTRTTGTDGLLDRFFNEARIQSSLRHPNVATLYDFTEVQGQPCIIMEYVDGQTLAERIRPSGPLPLSEALSVFTAVVEAIAYVHANGIVHRDIKSNNIKIATTGEVKLLDFGIAKSERSQQLTATGSVIGTLEYLSPEQLRGDVADARSDIWALGVLLFEMVTGRVPFEGNTIGELCKKIERVEYTPPQVLNPDTPREMVAIINKCLRKNPMDRYRVADDLLSDSRRLYCAVAPPGRGSFDLSANPQRTLKVVLASVDRKVIGVMCVCILAGALLIGGTYLGSSALSRGNSTQSLGHSGDPEDGNLASPASDTSAENQVVIVDVMGDKASVYLNGSLVGETPYSISTHIGETINIELRRAGSETLFESFSITAQTRNKTFEMLPVGNENLN